MLTPLSLFHCYPSNPCSFTCGSGFVASPAGDSPTDCVCSAPNTVCSNGLCADPSQCPSGSSPSGPTSSNTLVSRDRRAHLSARRVQNTCRREGMMACGASGMKGWECVDTKTDLERCELQYPLPGVPYLCS